MFCNNCGKQLADNARFCDGCGAQIGAPAAHNPAPMGYNGAPMGYAPVPVKAPNPTMENFTKFLKSFFTPGPVRTIATAAKSTSLEWLLFAGIGMLVYGFALATNIWQLLDSMLGAMSSQVMDQIFNYGQWLLYGILIGAFSYFLLSGLTLLTVKVIFKKNVHVNSIFNVVAIATVPLTLAYIVNLLLGFVWFPMVIVTFMGGILASAVLLYVGVQKLEKLEVSPFWAHTAIWTLAVLIVTVVLYLIVKAGVEDAVGNAMGAVSGLAGLFG